MKLLRTLLIAATASLAVFLPSAQAQLGVYGDFNASNLSNQSLYASSGWIYGGGGGAYLDHGHFVVLSVGMDLRANVQNGTFTTGGGVASGGTSTSTRLVSGYIGPRLAFRPHILPIKPYVEGLVGAANLQSTTTSAFSLPYNGSESFTGSVTRFSYQVVGGLDYTILPRIDWRVAEVGYNGLRAFGNNVNPITVSTGIVIRLPGIF